MHVVLGNHEAKMLLPPERRILVADNSKGFPLNPVVEDILVTEIEGIRFDPCALDASLELELRALNADRLNTLPGGLLSNEQIVALIQRRNRVVSTCSSRSAYGQKLSLERKPGEG